MSQTQYHTSGSLGPNFTQRQIGVTVGQSMLIFRCVVKVAKSGL